MAFLRNVFVAVLLVIHIALCAKKVDMVIYSFDRPLQLYALLESASMYLNNVGEIHVIYRASDERYEAGYCVVKEKFTKAVYNRQSDTPKQDFKPLTLDAVFESPNAHVIFAVDDIIITDFVDLSQCVDLMEKTNSYGFYLRLGKNVDFSYMENCHEVVPELTQVEGNAYSWRLAEGQREWRYAHTVDMTIYKKETIAHYLYELNYENPNSFEGKWSCYANKAAHCSALCFEHSKIVNLPLNLVQDVYLNNRHMTEYTSLQLLELFEQGLKINIHDLYKVDNRSPHMEYSPHFVMRLEERKDNGTKHFVVVVASYNNARYCEKNLNSLFMQKYDNYSVIYIDDCSSDGTGELVEEYIKEHALQKKVTLLHNRSRMGAMENQFRACYFCDDNSIIVILDGDDFFAHDNVLAYLNRVYSDSDIWMTYGQFKEVPSGNLGFCRPMPHNIVNFNKFREFPYLPSHLRTFYAGLFKQIKPHDLKSGDSFFMMTCDVAAMMPMIEMAREGHFKFISEVLYLYNTENAISDHRVSSRLQRAINLEVRSKQRYAPVQNYMRN